MDEPFVLSPALVRRLLESAAEGILIVDQHGKIVLANRRAGELFGHSREALLGRPIGDLLPERYRSLHRLRCAGYFEHPRQRAMGGGQAIVACRRDGSELPVDISLSYAQVENTIYAMCFISDISARVQAEQALQAYSQQLEEQVQAAQAQLLEQQLLQRDLELARQVQASLLPRRVPVLEGYEFAAQARPARYVSGDLYDFCPCDPAICHFVLADIAGKGVPAALLSATMRALVHSEMGRDSEPAAILSKVEAALFTDLERAEAFITVLAARLDALPGRLSYANAGHTEALWYRDGACRRLAATGLPLGIDGNAELRQETIYLRPGDVLVFYSDGITEAANARGELFGPERLGRAVSRHASLSAEVLADAIVQQVEAFRDDRLLSDDLTLLVLKVLPRSVDFQAPANLDHLREIVTRVHRCALAYGEELAYQLELATSEIVTNMIEHACHYEGRIRGQIGLYLDEIHVDLYDDGAPCDLASIPDAPLGEPQPGGYGLHIARQLLDELIYEVDAPAGNHWRLVKHVRGRKAAHAAS